QRTGVPSRDVKDLPKVLDSLAAAGGPFFVVGDFAEPQEETPALLTPRTADEQIFDKLKSANTGLVVTRYDAAVLAARGKKSPTELAYIKQAVDITVMAQKEAIPAIKPGMNEFEIQA